VKGFGGEQFALPDAVGRLRALRKLERTGEFVVISAADPLNLVGIVTPDAKVPAITRNRVLFRDGIAIGALEAGDVRRLAECELGDDALRMLLSRRVAAPALRAYLSDGRRERWLAKKRQSVIAVDGGKTD
jgi:ATP-dependent Lhr-like helicase